MKEDFYFLKTKADKFMEMADVAIERGHYDLSSLHLEQAAQLFLKYTIGIHSGDFPRIHDINELLVTTGQLINKAAIEQLMKEEQDAINDLYKSYFESRYFDEPFTLEQVTRLKNLVLKIKNIVGA